MSQRLSVSYEPDTDRTGKLTALVSAGEYSGVGSAWFHEANLLEFADRLSAAYPLPSEGLPELRGGYWRQSQPPELAEVHVGLKFYPIGPLGHVGCRVDLAVPGEETGRPGQESRVGMYPLSTSMIRELAWQDLTFEQVPITCYSSLGRPYLRWVDVGVPKINQAFIDSTFFLYKSAEDARNGGDAQGTGFVVSHAIYRVLEHSNAIRFTHYYAVTNAHVARSAPVVRLNRGNDMEVIPFDAADWEYHSSNDDVAIVPLLVQSATDTRDLSAISTQSFWLENDRSRIGVGDDVFMIGLFVDHEGKETNNPMARFGNISMMASENSLVTHGDQKRLSHIIDMHSRSGYSGSPVFVYRTFGSDLTSPYGPGESVSVTATIPAISDQQLRTMVGQRFTNRKETFNVQLKTSPVLRLLGIHWGQFPELWETSIQEAAADEGRPKKPRSHYVEGVSGMTLVAPASKILELIEMPKIEAKRIEAEKRLPRRANEPKLESAPPKLPSKEDANPSHAEDFNDLLDAAVRGKPSTD